MHKNTLKLRKSPVPRNSIVSPHHLASSFFFFHAGECIWMKIARHCQNGKTSYFIWKIERSFVTMYLPFLFSYPFVKKWEFRNTKVVHGFTDTRSPGERKSIKKVGSVSNNRIWLLVFILQCCSIPAHLGASKWLAGKSLCVLEWMLQVMQ